MFKLTILREKYLKFLDILSYAETRTYDTIYSKTGITDFLEVQKRAASINISPSKLKLLLHFFNSLLRFNALMAF